MARTDLPEGAQRSRISTGREIRLIEDDDGWWTASDVETGVTSQGETREAALSNLDEAVAGYEGAGREPTDAELREWGIDPDRNVSGGLEESDVFE